MDEKLQEPGIFIEIGGCQEGARPPLRIAERRGRHVQDLQAGRHFAGFFRHPGIFFGVRETARREVGGHKFVGGHRKFGCGGPVVQEKIFGMRR